jgi:hypothetical protein
MCEGPRPFIPVPNVFKVQLVYTLYSQRIENVFNVRSGGGVTAADADRIQGIFATWWNATARPQVSLSTSLVLMVLDALDAAVSLHREYTTGWTAVGSNGSAALPGGSTTCIKLATGTRGRSYRGRIYWPGLPGANVSAGLLTTAYRDALAAAVNTLRTNLAADVAGDKLVIVSYCSNKVWRAAGVATEVTSASAHTLVDSQRRRLIGRGL